MKTLALTHAGLKKMKTFRVQIVASAESEEGVFYPLFVEPLDVLTEDTVKGALYSTLSLLHRMTGSQAYESTKIVEDAIVELSILDGNAYPKPVVIAAPSESGEAQTGSDLAFWQDVMPEEFGLSGAKSAVRYSLELAKKIQDDIDRMSRDSQEKGSVL